MGEILVAFIVLVVVANGLVLWHAIVKEIRYRRAVRRRLRELEDMSYADRMGRM